MRIHPISPDMESAKKLAEARKQELETVNIWRTATIINQTSPNKCQFVVGFLAKIEEATQVFPSSAPGNTGITNHWDLMEVFEYRKQ